ncbi:hypothetical protein MMC13_005064 [Lambiella insularis]|nr:hypothetical protein [Lambiella insularis]
MLGWYMQYEPHAPAPNSALAIYRNAEAAQKAMSASPVRFVYGQVGNVIELGQSTPSDYPEQPLVPRKSAKRTSMDQSVARSSQYKTFEDGRREAHGRGTEGKPRLGSEAASKPLRNTIEPSFITNSLDSVAWGATFSQPDTIPTADSTSVLPKKTVLPRDPSSKLSPPPTGTIAPPRAPTSPAIRTPSSGSEVHIEPPMPSREVSLSISPSGLNHHSYIARQHYYGPWGFDQFTIPGEDLSKRAPMQGLADIRINMPEVPVRIRAKREQEKDFSERRGLRDLRKLWLSGMTERGDEIREWEARGDTSKRNWRSVSAEDGP